MKTNKTKKYTDTWNRMINFINSTKDESKKSFAQMLMNQYNTAGGRIIKGELISFLEHNA